MYAAMCLKVLHYTKEIVTVATVPYLEVTLSSYIPMSEAVKLVLLLVHI